MKSLTVDSQKIAANLEEIKTASGTENVIAVLKANAYGLGLREMSGALRELRVRRFAVSDPSDALKLREWGFGEEEILILRSTANEQDVKDILSACATATIGSYDAAVALNGIAEAAGISCDVHIKIDTGMGRYGFDPSELERVLSVFRYMKNLNVTGMYTHYANAFKSRKKTQAQYDRFAAFVQKVRDAGCSPGLLHASNSAAVFKCGVPSLDAVRVGSAIGGRLTVKGDFGLCKLGRLECPIAEIRWLQKGRHIGYGSAFTVRKPTKIAIIPVGTGDGFMLQKSPDSFRFFECVRMACSSMLNFVRRKRFYVHINGKRARIVGHVGISHTTVDVTNIECMPGTTVVFDLSPVFVPEKIERKYL